MNRHIATRSLIAIITIIATVVLLGLASSPLAQAQERERVFLRVGGADGLEERTLAMSMLFEGPLLKRGDLELAGTVEMEEVFAECREEIGVSASEERRCRLQAARRLTVSQIIELDVSTKDDVISMVMAVWDANSGGKVFGEVVRANATGTEAGVADVLPRLAASYLCFRDDCEVEETPAAAGPHTAKEADPTQATHSPKARRVTFLPHPREGIWTLHRADGVAECPLPCTRWVEPASGLTITALGDDGTALSSIQVPADLGYGPELPLEAQPELDSDWQTWEIASWTMLGISVGMITVGIAAMTAGDAELDTW